MASGPESQARAPGVTEVEQLRRAVTEVVHGKDDVVELALTTVIARGHLLLQDVPGVGKTTLAAALAQALGGQFSRIQFTSDLLPADITGGNVLDSRTGDFAFRPGPIFANVVLADEINRTTPRTQSALFEAMSEGQVTVDGRTHSLPVPFMVVATQNPFDVQGTYLLPDSQLDRFLMRLDLGYPALEDERAVLRSHGSGQKHARTVASPEALAELCAQAETVAVAEEVESYLLRLVRMTREDGRLLRGVSTRGALALLRAARALAFVRGRAFVVPEDVIELAVPVLGHRVLVRQGLTHREHGGPEAIRALLAELPAPG